MKPKEKKRNHARKTFRYQCLVRVTPPGELSFVGRVYSEYTEGRRRMICVQRPRGAGVAYPVRQVVSLEKR